MARREISRIGEPSGWLATLTSEQYGLPLPAIKVASAPCRLRRKSDLAALAGSKSGVNCIDYFLASYCNSGLFSGKRASMGQIASFKEALSWNFGHTSAQLALLVDRVRSPF